MHNNAETAASAADPTAIEPDWTAVSPRYATLLRLYVAFYTLPLAIVPHFLALPELTRALQAFSAGLVVLAAVLILVWVPRRVRYTQYRRTEAEMHMRTGLLWRTTTSVALNRVQHLEITQGPLQRLLGLSVLVLYTAGGHRSDLKLPGLASDTAEQLKQYLLHQIVEEEPEHEVDPR